VDDGETPGPGSYNDKTLTLGNTGLKFGIQKRCKNLNGKFQNLN